MFYLSRIGSLFFVLAASVFTVGCAGPAPNYSPSIDNVETLKKSGVEASRVTTFTVPADMPGANSVSIRANSMTSPVGANYGDYIAAALRQELELAKLYNAQSALELSGVLLRNNIDAGGISTNAGQIEVRFIVKQGTQVRFDKIKRVEHQWESSFAGAVAIPLAASNYPLMVQKVIHSLITDPDFVIALKK